MDDNTSPPSKVCSKCGAIKALDEFPKNGGGTLRPDCRACHRERMARSRKRNPEYMKAYRKANAARIAEKAAAWRAANPDYAREWERANREVRTAQSQAWRDANRDLAREFSRKWYAANREEAQRMSREWRQANPEKARAGERRRRALRASVKVETYTRPQVWALTGGRCGICELQITPSQIATQGAWHIDHIVPISLGGDDSLENVQPAHAWCNIRKGGRTQ